ncbi:exported protein of unknown function [Beijerinckiaceae bacterium RH AL1]|nr:hypothetical protein [Beijerinckiaceae bacterium]VVB42945.1 exported protein of unknown function [Beijerinckiaceae bacterium RH AL8]VVB42958.1 exported protein of unknown function [Beijerinckiaceae bacterium RH CH11]VVC53587.1 exported protein of unknown function [Beijerinckiaceae bacterium RH AL1]
MKRLLLLVPVVLGLSLPAVAEEKPRRDPPRQTQKTDYWLSEDMQRLAFWQSREPEVQTGRSVATH